MTYWFQPITECLIKQSASKRVGDTCQDMYVMVFHDVLTDTVTKVQITIDLKFVLYIYIKCIDAQFL